MAFQAGSTDSGRAGLAEARDFGAELGACRVAEIAGCAVEGASGRGTGLPREACRGGVALCGSIKGTRAVLLVLCSRVKGTRAAPVSVVSRGKNGVVARTLCTPISIMILPRACGARAHASTIAALTLNVGVATQVGPAWAGAGAAVP